MPTTADAEGTHGISKSGSQKGAATDALPGGFRDGQDTTNQEQEMRETSYFKQQTDDEGAPVGGHALPK